VQSHYPQAAATLMTDTVISLSIVGVQMPPVPALQLLTRRSGQLRKSPG
jgi:hypothetical protein